MRDNLTLIQISALESCTETSPFLKFTFPAYQQVLASVGDDPSIFVFVAVLGNKPAGLILAQVQAGVAHLLSVYVHPKARRQGVARALLRQMEQTLEGQDVNRFEVVYTDKGRKTEAFSALMSAAFWSPASSRMQLFTVSMADLIATEWITALNQHQAAQFEVCPWSEVPPADVPSLQESWIPSELHPAGHVPSGVDGRPWVPNVSFALKEQGKVVGWHLSHALDAERIRFSVTYVHPDVQTDLAMISLWYAAGMAAHRGGYTQAKLGVATHHAKMQDFCEKILGPMSFNIENSVGRYKMLVKEEEVWV